MTPNIRRGSTHKYDHFLTFINKTLSREEQIREFQDFSFSSTISRPRFQPNLKETSLIFKLINEMIRLEFLFERKQSIYVCTGNVDGVDPPNSTFVNLNLNSWKDWIMKLLVLWFIRGFFSRWSGWKRYTIVVDTLIEVSNKRNLSSSYDHHTPDDSFQFL